MSQTSKYFWRKVTPYGWKMIIAVIVNISLLLYLGYKLYICQCF